MSSLRELLDPETLTREDIYFSRDYSVEGYEPMPSSRVLVDPAYTFPRTGSLGYVPDDWQISRMDPIEVLESGWKEAEAAQTLVPWLLKNAASCNHSAAPYPPPPAHLGVPQHQQSLRLALKEARARGGWPIVIEQGDHRPTRRLVVRHPKALPPVPPLPALEGVVRGKGGCEDSEAAGSGVVECMLEEDSAVQQQQQQQRLPWHPKASNGAEAAGRRQDQVGGGTGDVSRGAEQEDDFVGSTGGGLRGEEQGGSCFLPRTATPGGGLRGEEQEGALVGGAPRGALEEVRAVNSKSKRRSVWQTSTLTITLTHQT